MTLAPARSPPRVLLLNSYAPPLGGAEEHVVQVQALLVEAGSPVEFHAGGRATGARDVVERFHNAAVARLVEERIREFRPDVVHVHNFLRRLSTAPFRVAHRLGVATLLTVHDFQLFCPRTWAIRGDGRPCLRAELVRCALGSCRGPLDGVRGRLVYAGNTFRVRRAARHVARLADAIVAPSRALADRVAGSLGRDVGVLRYPFPTTAEPLAPPGTRDVLFVGRVSEEKGLLEMLAALAPWPEGAAAVRLTIAGDGPALETVRGRARDLGLDERVTLLGRVPHDEVAGLMRRHGAIVTPSVWMDNSPLVIHEALAVGRPVLGSDRGGIPELVEDGRTGFIFEPLDRESCRTAFDRYGRLTADEHTTMTRDAYESARREGGGAGFLGRLLDVYGGAMAAAERRRGG